MDLSLEATQQCGVQIPRTIRRPNDEARRLFLQVIKHLKHSIRRSPFENRI